MNPYEFTLAPGGIQNANFLGALAMGIGSLIGGGLSLLGGAGSAIVGGGASLLGGGASLLGGAGSALVGGAGSLVGGAGSALFGGGQAAVPVMVGGEMGSLGAASTATTGGGILGGLFPAVTGAAGSLIDIMGSEGFSKAAQTGLGLYQMFNPPDAPVTGGGAWMAPTTRGALPTLPYVMPASGQMPIGQVKTQPAEVFTTPAATPGAKSNYTMPLLIGGVILLLIFMRKK